MPRRRLDCLWIITNRDHVLQHLVLPKRHQRLVLAAKVRQSLVEFCRVAVAALSRFEQSPRRQHTERDVAAARRGAQPRGLRRLPLQELGDARVAEGYRGVPAVVACPRGEKVLDQLEAAGEVSKLQQGLDHTLHGMVYLGHGERTTRG